MKLNGKRIISALLFALLFELIGGLLYGLAENFLFPGWEARHFDDYFIRLARITGFCIGLGHIVMVGGGVFGFCLGYRWYIRRESRGDS